MPPYTPNKSKAQQKKLFVLAEQGKISMAEARGKARASNFKKLPEHVRKKKGARKRSHAQVLYGGR